MKNNYGLEKVINPYAAFIRSSLLSLILFFTAVLSVSTGFFGIATLDLNKNENNVVYGLSGDGSRDNPYLIGSVNDWNTVTSYNRSGNNWSNGKYFKQTANLDFRDFDDDEYYTEMPASKWYGGSSSTYFKGSYNGQGYDIYGVYDNTVGEDYVGLFGYVFTAVIMNIKIKNVSYYAKDDYIGVVTGYAYYSTILNVSTDSNCRVNGDRYAGAIVGRATYSNIIDCHNVGTPVGTSYYNGDYTGGIIGYSYGNKVHMCSSTGSVYGEDYGIGGLIGYATDSRTLIENCWADPSSVNASSNQTSTSSEAMGGIVGRLYQGTVNYCWADTRGFSLTNSGYSSQGAIIGSKGSYGVVSSCVGLVSTYSIRGIAYPASNSGIYTTMSIYTMGDPNWFAYNSFNFDAIWEDDGYFMKFKMDEVVVLKQNSNSYDSNLELNYDSGGYEATIFTQPSLTSTSIETMTAYICHVDSGYVRVKAIKNGVYNPYQVTLTNTYDDIVYNPLPTTLTNGIFVYPDGFNTIQITDAAVNITVNPSIYSAVDETVVYDGIDTNTTNDSTEWIPYGDTVYLNSNAVVSGYRFEGWYKNGTGSRLSESRMYSFTADETNDGAWYEARYIEIYYLTVYDNCDVTTPTMQDGLDTDDLGSSSEYFDVDTSVTVTALDSYTDYDFIGWYQYYDQTQLVNENASFNYTITGQSYLIALYKVKFLIDAGSNGAVSDTLIWGFPNDTVVVTATPNNGYNFDYWDGSYFPGSTTSSVNPYTFTIGTGYKTATANFIVKSFYTAKLLINVNTPTSEERDFFTASYIKGTNVYDGTTSALSSTLTKSMHANDSTLEEIIYIEQGSSGKITEIGVNASSNTDGYYELYSVSVGATTLTGSVVGGVWKATGLNYYASDNLVFYANYKIKYQVYTDAHFSTNLDVHYGPGSVNINKNSNGYVYVMPGDHVIATNSIDSGYIFDRWENRLTGLALNVNDDLTDFNMPYRYVCLEGFTTENHYKVTVKTYLNNNYDSGGTSGKVSINGTGGDDGYQYDNNIYYNSSLIILTVDQDISNYKFVGWSIGTDYSSGIINTNQNYNFTFTGTSDTTYYAHYRQIYTVSLTSDAFISTSNYYLTDGIDADDDTSTSEKYLYGSSYTIYVTAYATAPYVKITEGATTRYGYTSKTTGTHELTRNSISANTNFDIEYLFAVDLTVSGNGSISLATPSYVSSSSITGGTRYYFKGNETKTITAVPTSTSVFNSWSGASTSSNTSITLNAGNTLNSSSSNIPKYTANFNIASWVLTALEVTNGSISDDGGNALVEDGNDADTTDESSEIVTYATSHTLHVTNVNSGYEFLGWSTNSTGSSIISGSATDADTGTSGYQWVLSSMPNNDATYYAVFESLEYTLTVNIAQSGAGSVTVSDGIDADTSDSTSEIFKYNQSGIILDAPSSSTNYQFDGWYKDGVKVYSVTDPSNITYSWVGDVIFTAVYKIKYSLSVGAGSGTITPTSGYYAQGDTISYTLNPSSGYEFDYWSGDTTGVSSTISPSATITAQSTPQSTIVNYTERTDIPIILKVSTNDVENNAGGTVSGGGTATFNSTKIVTATANSNYTFLGWSTSANGSIISGSSTDSDTGTAGYQWNAPIDTVSGETYYAKFYYNNYTITYIENGGTDLSNVSGLLFKSSYTLPIEGSNAGEIKKDGYNFAGWYKDSGFTDGNYTSLTNISSNTILYAKWGAVSYTVRSIADRNGGSGSYGTVKINNGTAGTDVTANLQYLDGITETETLTATIVSSNYDFMGWSTSANGSIISGSTTDDDTGTAGYQWDIVVPIGGVTYYAVFYYNNYTISYVENGGNAVADETSILYGDDVTLATSDEIYKSGYVFKGWTITPSDTGSYVTTTTNITSDLTYYAQWRVATNWQELKQIPSTNYQIWTPEELAWFAYTIGVGNNLSGQTWTIMADIDLNGDQFGFSSDSIEWVPAGSYSSYYFSGTLDGNSKTIEDMYIDTTLSYGGFISYVKNGEIRDLTLSSVNVTGTNSVGALTGVIDNSIITNIAISGDINGKRAGGIAYNIRYSSSQISYIAISANVTSTEYFAGGISAVMDGGSHLYNSYTTTSAVIDGVNHVGGLVGYIANSTTITNCYNKASVSGSNVGGIVGVMDNSTVTNCYNLGSINREGSAAGGVIGYMRKGAYASDCYNSSAVTTNHGLVGTMQLDGNECTIENCYYDSTKAGSGTNGVGSVGDNVVSNCTGLTTAQTKNQSYYSNFDFTNGGDWVFSNNVNTETDNGGLPVLQAFHPNVNVVTFKDDILIRASNPTSVVGTPFSSYTNGDTTYFDDYIARINSGVSVYNEYEFNIEKAGDYTISAYIMAEDGTKDSFYASMDSTTLNVWHTSSNGITWFWSNWSSVSLTAGTHTFRLAGREYTPISAILISANADSTGIYDSRTLVDGSRVSVDNMPADPSEAGYSFVGWGTTTSSANFALQGAQSTNVSSDTVVYSVYDEVTYNVNVSISSDSNSESDGNSVDINSLGVTSKNFDYDTINISVTATDSVAGYNFHRWMLNGTQVSTSSTYTFDLTLVQNYTFVAEYYVELTFVETGYTNEGVITPAVGTYNYVPGSSLTISGSVNPGYQIQWTSGLSGTSITYLESTISVPSSSVTYTLNITVQTGISVIFIDKLEGVVSSVGGDANYTGTNNVNETLTLVPNTNKGYVFVSWEVDTGTSANLVNNSYVIDPADAATGVKLVANYARDSFSVQVLYTAGGTATVWDGLDTDTTDESSEEFYYLETARLTATPNDGYVFDGWYEDSSYTNPLSSLNPYDVTTTYTESPHSAESNIYYAKFSKDYFTVTVVAETGGSATVEDGADADSSASTSESFEFASSNVTLTAVKNEGYVFDGWFAESTGGTALTVNLNYDITVTSNADDNTYYARFSKDNFTITVVSDGNGTVIVEDGLDADSSASESELFEFETTGITITASANDGYKFDAWYSDASFTSLVTSENPYNSVVVTASAINNTYYANFVEETYSITTYAVTQGVLGSNGGTVKAGTDSAGASSTQSGLFGSDVNITASVILTNGYVFEGWFDNQTGGTALTTNFDYTVTIASNTVAEENIYYARFIQATTWDELAIAPTTAYTITTPHELAYLATIVNGGATQSGLTWTVANNINLNATQFGFASDSIEWTPIGSYSSYLFRGTFDGGNNEIIDMYITGTTSFEGLFEYLYYATVKDLILTDVDITDNYGAGALAGVIVHSNINNITVSGSITADRAGGVAYYIGSGTTSNITITADVTSTGTHVGGIAGRTDSSAEIYNCYIESSSNITGTDYVGGIVGYADAGTTIHDCYNKSNIDDNSSSNYVGGITGCVLGSSVVYGCYNEGYINGYNILGGITGRINNATVRECYNIGNINASYKFIGGIAGQSYGNAYIYDCYNLGDTTALLYSTSTNGGIVGYIASSGADIYNCYSSGNNITLNGTMYNRSIVGYVVADITVTISDCYFDKTLNASGTTGIATPASATITNCVGLTQTELQNQDNFTGFNFASGAQWAMSADINSGYPVLQAFYPNVAVVDFDKTINDVDWTAYSTKTIVIGGYIGTNNMPTDPTRTGYNFVGWGDETTSLTSDFTANETVSANDTVYSVWSIKSFTATFNSNGGSSVDSITQDYGTYFNIPSAPSYTEYYRFDGWLQTSPLGSTYAVGVSYQLTQNVTFTAQWTELARIVVTDDGNCSVTAVAGYYEEGDVIGLDFILADDGYEFYRWTKNGISYSTSTDLNYTVVSSDLSSVSTFIANVSGVYYDITINQASNGTISPDGGADNIEEIQETVGSLTFTVTPNTNYLLVDILVDGVSTGTPVSTGDSYTFSNITANHTITAQFRSGSHTITVTQTSNGIITPSTTTVADGDTQSFSIAPNSGYKLDSVTIDASSLDISSVTEGQGYSYTFINVVEDHTVTATYSELYYDITVVNNGNGTVIPNGGADNIEEIQAEIGEITFYLKPNAGYTLSSLVIGGLSVTNLDAIMIEGYLVTNVQNNTTLTATFATVDLWTSYTTTPSGTGDWDNPYIINSNEKLAWVAAQTNSGNSFANKYFEISGNIDLDGKIWVAIGISSHPFEGNVDGVGSTITNMYANTAQSGIGLFGYASEAQISNLTLTNAIVMASNSNAGGIIGLLENSVLYNVSYDGVVRSSYDNTGGIVGRAENSYVINVSNYADVYSDSYDAGGIVGDLQLGSSVFDSKNYGYVEGLSRSGGIAGSSSSSTVKSNANYGAIVASTEAGGIVGDLSSSTLENCFNRGNIYANSEVAGIVGDATSSTISYSYSTGAIDGVSSNINGVVGRTTSTTVTNSYYLENTVDGGNDSSGNDATSTELKSVASSIFGNYDSSYIWQNDSLNANDGYIYLQQYLLQSTISKAIENGTLIASTSNGDTVIQEDVIFIQRGKNQDFVVTADSYYKISLIEDNGVSQPVTQITAQTYSLTTVTGEHDLYAEFSRIQNTITVTQGDNGTIIIDPTESYSEDPTDVFGVNQGDSITFTITPNSGYKIVSITTDSESPAITAIVGDSQDYTFVVTGDHTITATYGLVTWLDYTTAPSGLGTEENPYLIYLPEELAYFSAQVKAGNETICAALMQDVDISAHLWYPIGNELDSKMYNGAFEGNGYTINGITIGASQNYNFAGLFGRNSGEIKNITLTNVDIIGDIRVGAVSGDNFGIIDNCYISSGTVTGYQFVGGIVGDNHTGAYVDSCANNATILDKDNAQTYAGGIVGVNTGSIINSYNTGIVGSSDVSLVGGITGKNYNSASSISGCYNSGTIIGNDGVGGVTGGNLGTITNSYNNGDITGSNNVAGITGTNTGAVTYTYSVGTITGTGIGTGGVCADASGTVTNSYYLTGTVNGSNDGTGYNRTYSQLSMQEQDDDTTYVDWDFNEAWYLILTENGDYPQLTYVAEFTYTKIVIKYIGTGSVSPSTGITVMGSASQSYVVSPNGDSKIAEFKIDGEVITNYTDTNAEFTYTFTNVTGKNVLYVEFEKLYWIDFPSTPSGLGTELNPYKISSPEELAWLSNLINAGSTGVYAIQTSNISLYGKAWTAIGTNSNPFEDSFYDGDGYNITDMYINEDLEYQGLFGYAINSSITNVNIYTGTVIANNYAGGLVGYASGCIVKNVISDVDVTAQSYVGGLIGLVENDTTILGVKNYGITTADNSYIGGLVGYIRNSTIMAGVNEGDVIASDASSVGGLVGGLQDSQIINCYNIADITADGNAGGLVGELLYNATSTGDASLIADCYNVGDITANYSVGGIVGYDESNGSDMENTYYISTALYGNGVTADITGSFTKKTSTLLKALATYNNSIDDDSDGKTNDADNNTDWDFDSWWQINSGINNGYPTLQLFDYENIILGLTDGNGSLLPDGAIKSNSAITQIYEMLPNSGFVVGSVIVNGVDVTPTVIASSGFYTFTDAIGINLIEVTFTREYWIDHADNTNITGTGLSSNPYIISTAEELAWITYENNILGNAFAGDYFEIDANIPLYGKYWTPIGSESTPFEGNVDGVNHSISNLLIEDVNASYQGLFGYISGSTIKNITLVEPQIEADSYVGAFVGFANSGASLSQLHTTSTAGYVSGVQNYAGGIIGYLSDLSSIINSSSVISVSGSSYISDTEAGKIGGIAGYVDNSLITQTYNTGNISGNNYAGGIVGYVNATSTVMDSYNRGNVSATETAGGIVAYVNASTNSIETTYNTGNVSGNLSGAILGDNQNGSTLSYNYFLTGSDSYGVGSPASSFSSQTESKTSGIMTTNHASNYVTWDFTSIWDTDPLSNNNGYPTLQMLDATLYTIIAEYGDNGIITPGGATIFKEGTDQDFYIIPDSGYYISYAGLNTWEEDYEAEGDYTTDLIQFIGETDIQTYSFTDINENYVLQAEFSAITYAISVSTGTGGASEDEGVNYVNGGSNFRVDITPNSGMEIDTFSLDGIAQEEMAGVSGDSYYVIQDITENHSVYITFRGIVYEVLSSVDGNGGTISPEGLITYTQSGLNQTFIITPNEGYQITSLTVNDVEDISYAGISEETTFTLYSISMDYDVVVTFEKSELTLTTTTGNNGTISPLGTSTVEYGSSVIVTATPNIGYKIKSFTVNGVSIDEYINSSTRVSYTIDEMTEDTDIDVTYQSVAYTIDFTTNIANAGNPQYTGDNTSGQTITLQSNAYDGYTFSMWELVQGSGTLSGNSYTIDSSDITGIIIKAYYSAKTVNVNITTDAQGDITGCSVDGNYSVGDDITLVVSLTNVGYEFSVWSTNVQRYDSVADELVDLEFTSSTYNYTITGEDVEYAIANNSGIIVINAEYELETCSITFNADGGQPEIQLVDLLYGDNAPNALGNIISPTQGGVDFIGWYTEKDGAGTAIESYGAVSGAVTFYADYGERTTVIIMVADPEEGGDPYYTGVVSTGEIVTLYANEYAGYVLTGWTVDGDNGTLDTQNNTYTVGTTVDTPITITAYYSLQQYHIAFDANGGSPTPATMTYVDYGTTVTLPAEPTLANYDFAGWEVVESAELFNPNNYIANTNSASYYEATATGLVTLASQDYRTWSNVGNYSLQANTQYRITAYNPSRAYIEIGDGTGYKYYSGADNYYINIVINTTSSPLLLFKIDPTNAVAGVELSNISIKKVNGFFTESTVVERDYNLMANWYLSQYTVSFNTNGTAEYPASNNPSDITVTGYYSVSSSGENMPENPIREGYTFVKWVVDISDGVNLVDDDFDSTTIIYGNLTVKAYWAINTYEINFYKYEYDVTAYHTISGVEHDTTVTLPVAPLKEGYSFIGWKIIANGSGTFDATTVVTDNYVIVATFEINIYAVTFNEANGNSTYTINVTYGESILDSAMPADPTYYGYTFSYWEITTGNAYGNNVGDVFNKDYIVYENITATAQWNIVSYTVTFDTNGGDAIESVQTEYLSTITLPTATRLHYIAGTWTISIGNVYGNTVGTEFTETTVIYGDVTIQISWTEIDYTVTFNPDNTESSYNIIVTYGLSISTDSDVSWPTDPEKAGYLFTGWVITTENSYGNSLGADFIDTSAVYGDFTVTAIWDQATNWIELANGSNITGAGTEGSPFTIYTPEGLAYLSALVISYEDITAGEDVSGLTTFGNQSGVYWQIDPVAIDIDLNSTQFGWTADTLQWTPIGSASTYFAGNFNGNNVEIADMLISNSLDNQGLFGITATGSLIENMYLTGVSVSANENVGGLTGQVLGTLNNVLVYGNVYATSGLAGGIAGYSSGALILTNLENYASVTSNGQYTGGIIGRAYQSMTNCVNYGVVSSTVRYTGGIAGYFNGGTINNCYNDGTVTSTAYTIGGIVGQAHNTAIIQNSYNSINATVELTIAVETNYGWVGGIAGYADGSQITNCYNAGTVTSLSKYFTAGIIGEMSGLANVDSCYTTADSYVSGMQYVGGVIGKQNLADTSVTNCYNAGEVYGTYTVGGVTGYVSTGSTLDNNYTATTSYVEVSIQYGGGVVGENASIINDNYNQGTVMYSGTSREIAGIAGRNYGTINNCYNTVDASVSAYYVAAGIVGENASGAIIYQCYNDGNVIAVNNNVGGIVGNNFGTANECFNSATITGGGADTGGIAGNNKVDTGVITNSYNIGAVNGASNTGGIVGVNYNIIENSYNIGVVTGTIVGAIVGRDNSIDTLANNYFIDTLAISGLGNTSTSPVGQAESYTSAQLQSASNFNNWNFADIWGMSDISYNNGYPILRWQITINHTITASKVDDNGTITPDGVIISENPINQDYSMTPNDNYKILTVLINGVEDVSFAGTTVEQIYSFISATGDNTIVVEFEVNSVIVTFDGNGADSVSETEIEVVIGNSIDPLPTASKLGYNFDNWNTDFAGTGDILFTTTIITETITYYAIFVFDGSITINSSYSLVNVPDSNVYAFVKIINTDTGSAWMYALQDNTTITITTSLEGDYTIYLITSMHHDATSDVSGNAFSLSPTGTSQTVNVDIEKTSSGYMYEILG